MNSYNPPEPHEILQSDPITPLTDADIENVGGDFAPLFVIAGLAIGMGAVLAPYAGLKAGLAAR